MLGEEFNKQCFIYHILPEKLRRDRSERGNERRIKFAVYHNKKYGKDQSENKPEKRICCFQYGKFKRTVHNTGYNLENDERYYKKVEDVELMAWLP